MFHHGTGKYVSPLGDSDRIPCPSWAEWKIFVWKDRALQLLVELGVG